MITAGEPQEFVPLGREHLANHPGDVYLPVEITPAAPTASALDFSRDLLRALRGVTLKDEPQKEVWFLKESLEGDGEEEFYFSGKIVIWSKSSGHGIRNVYKSFTLENSVYQVLWADFNICSSKPRTLESEFHIQEDKTEAGKSSVLSGVCVIEASTVTVFSKSGEDFIATIPFQVSRTWATKYGLLFERNVSDCDQLTKSEYADHVPIVFSMLHPLDDVAPVIRRVGTSSSAANLSFFCDPSEEIIFTSSKPSLALTFNKKQGVHSVWKLRTTTFEEADFACSKVMFESQLGTNTPLNHTSNIPQNSSGHSKFGLSSRTPSQNTSSPFRSHASSRVSSPCGILSRSVSPAVSSLTHMATLSRSHSPSINCSISRQYKYTPFSATNYRSALSATQNSYVCEFMDPLAPDLCFDHVWTETLAKKCREEPATKAFLSLDITGHNFLCYILAKHKQLKLIKFEESNDNSQWIFGTSSVISALDAEALPTLNLIIVLDTNFTLTLYTGVIKVSKVHIADILGPFNELAFGSSNLASGLFGTPRRSSLVTSTRPPSAMEARFGDEVHALSPVVVNIDDTPPKSILVNEEISFSHIGPIRALRDAVRNRVTMETSNGCFRIPLPKIAESAVVTKCLHALRHVLPRDIYTHVFVKWYCTRNAPGPSDMSCESELNSFLLCILSITGYDPEGFCLGGFTNLQSTSSPVIKKQKTSESGSDDDWAYLLSSNLHNSLWNNEAHWLGLDLDSDHSPPELESSVINTSAILHPYIAHVMFALHLVYEDCKTNVLQWNDLPQLCSFLYELARDTRSNDFTDHYWKDFPYLFKFASKRQLLSKDEAEKIHFPSYFCFRGIFKWMYRAVKYQQPTDYPHIPHVTVTARNLIVVYLLLTVHEFNLGELDKFLTKIMAPGLRFQDDFLDLSDLQKAFAPCVCPKKAVVVLLTKLGLTTEMIDTLPVGLALGVRDAILHCRNSPLHDWSGDCYSLIGRRDLLSLHLTETDKFSTLMHKTNYSSELNKSKTLHISTKDNNEDGFLNLDHEVLRLRFSKDHRIHDVYHMLQSSKPVRIVVQQRPEVSDHEFIEEQERHLYSLCIRTMALPVGRGMFTLRSYSPVVTETLPIPKLCLTGRAPPRNTTVDLSHIDVPPNMNMWPLFHNGVAAGLRISPNASQIDSTWMVYNKPRSSSNDTPTEHAGFLMALGLNGHLSNLTTMSIHDYLCKGHELTSVGILLGVSAAKRGTMDLGATKMLSIHIEALLPPTSTELDVPAVVQVSAVLGIGLLYQGSAHHHMAEVLLGEIGRPPGPEMEHCVDRESYSLAAGLALGLVTLGKGKEVSGLTDLPMADQLYHYMVGGHKRPLTGIHKEKHKSPSYQIREGDCVNVDVTSPGATLALGMMFFDTGNQAIADWMTAPDTQFLLDMVRPDFLLLRTLSKGLILWSTVYPSTDWIESHLPEIVATHAFKRGLTNADVDYETMSQAYCNIIAGSCLCLGLKFAGSANSEAFNTLMHYAKFFLSLTRKIIGDQAGRSTIETCLNVSVLSLAMVMAGTGDLDVLRICRHLRSRISQSTSYVLYGSHMATHMALGLLFLGGGKFTLSTSPLSIGAMVCAFFPKFPTHSNDNRYHLQAFYHLYVLAAEPRLIIPRHIDSNKPLYTKIRIIFKDTKWYQNVEYTIKAPCLLPELKLLEQVIVDDTRYWPILFKSDNNWNVLCNLLDTGGTLHVKQNAGCLPYNEDPQGFRSLSAQTYIKNSIHGYNLKNVPVSKFSCNPLALNFASCFLQSSAKTDKEKSWQQKICGLLFECASQEKMEVLPACIMLNQMSSKLQWKKQTMDMCQTKMLNAYRHWVEWYNKKCYTPVSTLLRPDFVLSIEKNIDKSVLDHTKELREHLMRYFSEGWTLPDGNQNKFPPSLAGFLLLHEMYTVNTPQVLPLAENTFSLLTLCKEIHNVNVFVSTVTAIYSVFSCTHSNMSAPET